MSYQWKSVDNGETCSVPITGCSGSRTTFLVVNGLSVNRIFSHRSTLGPRLPCARGSPPQSLWSRHPQPASLRLEASLERAGTASKDTVPAMLGVTGVAHKGRKAAVAAVQKEWKRTYNVGGILLGATIAKFRLYSPPPPWSRAHTLM